MQGSALASRRGYAGSERGFDMVGLVAAMVIGFAAILIVGMPLIDRLVDRQLLGSRPFDTYDPGGRETVFHRTQIEPLDFGPAPLNWPSEAGSMQAYEEKLVWPSSTWDDDVFGRADVTQAAEAARLQAEAVAQQALSERAKSAANAEATPKPAKKRKAASKTRTARPRNQGQPRRQTQPAPASKPKMKVKLKPRAEAAPEPSGAISPNQVAALVRKEGLADAVAILRKNTGLSLDEITDLLMRADA